MEPENSSTHKPTRPAVMWRAFVETFRTISLTVRILIVIMLTLAFGTSLVALLGTNIYRSQKKETLIAFQTQKVGIVQARLKSFVMERSSSETFPRNNLPFSTADAEIPRLPTGDEIFIGFKNNFPVAVGSKNSEKIWTRELTDLDSLWEGGEDFTYVTTNTGRIVASNKSAVVSADAAQSFRNVPVLLGSLDQQNTIFTESSAYKKSIVSYARVENTNLVIFCETSLSGFLQPIMALSLGLASVLIALCCLGGLLAMKISFLLSDTPSEFVVDVLLAEQGKACPREVSGGKEFQIIHEGMCSLGEHVSKQREEFLWSEDAKSVYSSLIEKYPSFFNRRQLLVECAGALKELFFNKWPALTLTIYIFSTEDANSLDAQPLKKVYLLLSGVIVAEPKLRTVENEGWNATQIREYAIEGKPRKVSSREVFFPIMNGNEPLGGLLFAEKDVETLTREHLEWITLVCDLLARGYHEIPVGKLDEKSLSA